MALGHCDIFEDATGGSILQKNGDPISIHVFAKLMNFCSVSMSQSWVYYSIHTVTITAILGQNFLTNQSGLCSITGSFQTGFWNVCTFVQDNGNKTGWHFAGLIFTQSPAPLPRANKDLSILLQVDIQIEREPRANVWECDHPCYEETWYIFIYIAHVTFNMTYMLIK